MPTVRQTEEFDNWIRRLRDSVGRAIIARRIKRLAQEGVGDVKSVGSGVFELRIHIGPGYRVYFVRRGNELILLLCGGDKGSQDSDIARAKRLAEEEAPEHEFEDEGV